MVKKSEAFFQMNFLLYFETPRISFTPWELAFKQEYIDIHKKGDKTRHCRL